MAVCARLVSSESAKFMTGCLNSDHDAVPGRRPPTLRRTGIRFRPRMSWSSGVFDVPSIAGRLAGRNGPRTRNAELVRDADAAVLVWGPNDWQVRDLSARCRARGIPVRVPGTGRMPGEGPVRGRPSLGG